MIDLPERVALVTGAGGGIGAATARTFADNGAYVVVTDVIPEIEDVAADIKESGGKAIAFEMDRPR